MAFSAEGSPDPRFLGAISHELHQTAQPLSLLQGWLEMALLTPHSAEEYKRIIQRAIDHSKRLSGCFDHVRELVRLEESQTHGNEGIEPSHV